jgi:hypothetical protein
MLAFSQIYGRIALYNLNECPFIPSDAELLAWDLETIKSFVEDRPYVADRPSDHVYYQCWTRLQAGELLIEYTRLNKIEHVEYLLSYLLPYHKLGGCGCKINCINCYVCKLDSRVRYAFKIADDSYNEELIQLFQNYFQKQKLNLPPSGYQWR